MNALYCQLIGRDNGAGLGRDLIVLAEALRAGGTRVHTTALPHRGRLAQWLTRARLTGRASTFDFNLMLERVRPEFARAARCNVLVPNPEYFRAQDGAALSCIDEIWVKTRHAQRLFEVMDRPVRYMGFTSLDCLDHTVPRQHAFFHGPGRSNNKGTAMLLKLWAAHPEWPVLTVVWRSRYVKTGPLPGNIHLLREWLDETSYRRLQNQHSFHLCPSQTEGYGHYLVEAMSCAAVVITLDAEPMNELVTPECGLLVRAKEHGTQDLAMLYAADEVALTTAIERCISMSDSQIERLGQAARCCYERCRDDFYHHLGSLHHRKVGGVGQY